MSSSQVAEFTSNNSTENTKTYSQQKVNNTNLNNVTNPTISTQKNINKQIQYNYSLKTEKEILTKIIDILEKDSVTRELNTTKILNLKNLAKKQLSKVEQKNITQKPNTLKVNNKSTIIKEINTNGIKNANEISENISQIAFVKLILDNDNQITDTEAVDFAIEMYGKMNPSRQKMLLTTIGNIGLNQLLPHTPEDVLLSMEGETFTNFYATNLVKKEVKETKEKAPYYEQNNSKEEFEYA